MTNEKAIEVLTNHRRFIFEDSEEDIAIVMAISALEEKQTNTAEIKPQPMVFFSDRIMLADEYREWIAENNVKDTPESVIAFVQRFFDMAKFTEWKQSRMKGE